MNAKEKFKLIADFVLEKSQLHSPDFEFRIDHSDFQDHMTFEEFGAIMHKLQDQYEVIEIVASPADEHYYETDMYGEPEAVPTFGAFYIKVKEFFDAFYDQTYNPQMFIKSDDDILYELKYNPTNRKLLLNNFLLSKVRFDSENEKFLGFLFENANAVLTKEQIETGIGQKLQKTLNKIIDNLGFRGDIRKAFIDLSKEKICLRNPITRRTLKQLGLEELSFCTDMPKED